MVDRTRQALSEIGKGTMANICTNKVMVTGPAAAVALFVEVAVGPVSEEAVQTHSTELRIIQEVEAGLGVEEAFRSANLRLDAISARLTSLPPHYEMSGDAILAPPADFESWREEVLDWIRAHQLMEERGGSVRGKTSHLSFARLVPMPEEVKAESWRLAAYSFALSEWGPKFFFDSIGAPEVSAVQAFGLDAAGGDATAIYPLFDTPNSPVFPGLLNASKDHPDLLFISGFVDEDNDDFKYFACRAGEAIVQGAFDSPDELPDSCFGSDGEHEGDEERYLRTSATLDHLTETAAIEALDRARPPTP